MQTIEKRSMANSYAGWLMLILPFMIFIAFIIAPLYSNFTLSFQKISMFGENAFVGLDNYRSISEDKASLQALLNTFFSPLLALRFVLLVAAPLAFALLLMELRLYGRIAGKIVATLFIVFSSATILALFYRQNIAAALAAGSEVDRTATAFIVDHGMLSNLLLGNGLALSLPLGSALFLAIMGGAKTMVPDPGKIYNEFWSRAWQVLIGFAIFVLGFSLTSLEGSNALKLPLDAGSNIITHSFDIAFRYFRMGNGAALIELLIVPLILMGLGLLLVQELSKSEISIRYVPKIREKLTAGNKPGTSRIIGIIFSAIVIVNVIIVLWGIVGSTLIGNPAGFPVRDSTFTGRFLAPFFGSMAQSLRCAFPSAFICLMLSMTAGFVLGYLKPHGAKALLIIIGTFIFITPALVIIPWYLFAKSLGLVNTLTSVILPGIVSPLGILLFTWFFRGVKDELSALEASGSGVDLGLLQKRILSALVLFSLPLFAVYMIASLNQILMPFAILMKQDLFTLPIFLMMQQGSFVGIESSMLAPMARLGFLQYIVPLALLVVSAIAVFPRLAVVLRKKDEAAFVPREVLSKVAKAASPKAEKIVLSEPLQVPQAKAWMSIFPLCLFVVAMLLIIPGYFSPNVLIIALAACIIGLTIGSVLYYVYVYMIHKTLAFVTDGKYPIKPGTAVLFHFIPIFNIYWMFKWIAGVSAYINDRTPKQALLPWVFLFIYYATFIVSVIIPMILLTELAYIWDVLVVFIAVTVQLAMTLYLAERLGKAIVVE
jgi:ABC-type glycerol-3-phosphate transport system permease component